MLDLRQQRYVVEAPHAFYSCIVPLFRQYTLGGTEMGSLQLGRAQNKSKNIDHVNISSNCLHKFCWIGIVVEDFGQLMLH
jgi:hypothetical protein